MTAENKKVLIVDDTLPVLMAITRILKRQISGIEAVGCSTWEAAQQYCKEHTPDLVVLDYYLPDSPEQAHVHDVIAGGLKVVVLSGACDTDFYALRDRYSKQGIPFVEKPLELVKFVQLVRSLLALPSN